MLMPGWWFAASATSILDRHDNTPDLLENARSVRCPCLFLVGDMESTEIYPAERFASVTAGPSEAKILPNCDHWYTGHEDTVARFITQWLSKVFG